MKSNQTAPDTEGASLQRILQHELASRCTKNRQYLLRAFARDLETDHSTLSQILRGRRTLTDRAIRKLGESLGLSADDIDQCVLREARRAPAERKSGSVRVLRELTEDTLSVISGFEHYAILELTHLDDFRPDVLWISRVLGLTPDEVNVAVARLCRLGLLAMVSPTEWVDSTGDVTHLLDGLAYEAVWRLSERARRHAIEIAVGASPHDRLHELSSTTLAVDQRRIPEALRILAKARNDVLRVLSESDRRDHVYHLDISMVPLTGDPDSGKDEGLDE